MMQKQIVPGRIIEFDATALRRQAMRNRSAGEIGIMPTSPLADDVVSDSGSSSVTLTSSTDQETSVGVNRSEMQSFLINFVIEQTGYPEEIVELDADLEGDLGIDSIKKAQLFGEIGEQYKVQARENLSFDDFPTLRHVLDFLCENVVSGSASSPAPSTPSSPEQAGASGVNRSEMQSFLINFVIEQTGYPEEIVELDADLEGDLGIDSIKKAQLFGEIGEQYKVQARENLSFDDFPTLRHVLDFLCENVVSGSASSPAPSTPSSPEQAGASGVNRSEMQSFLINFVIEQTGYPEEIVELDADLEGDLGIDSIKKAQLFGEIGEQYKVQARENLSFDDFPTLRHVLDFLCVNVT